MTHSKGNSNNSKGWKPWEHFLELPNRSRAALLIGPPRLPRPLAAVVHDGLLKWISYYRDLPPKLPPDLQAPPPDEIDGPPKLQAIPPRLCFAFARLAQGSQEQIRCFAERWGPLGFELSEGETIDNWRDFARLAQALLRFTAALSVGDPGDEEDWRVICQSTPAKVLERRRWSRELQLTIVAAAMNILFSRARGHRILTVGDKDLRIQLNASNLMGILVAQIAHVIARSDQKVVCAGCRNPFMPSRPITRGSRQYCTSCRKAKFPQRDAARAYRARREASGRA
jgi:hypothetical protein